jgi:hypothetical protein
MSYHGLRVLSLLAVAVAEPKYASLIIPPDHETTAWRRAAGRPEPSLRKAVVWTRHEQVGIGNTLGGFARVMLDALAEDRAVVIHSIILQKFCEIVQCAVNEIPGEG